MQDESGAAEGCAEYENTTKMEKSPIYHAQTDRKQEQSPIRHGQTNRKQEQLGVRQIPSEPVVSGPIGNDVISNLKSEVQTLVQPFVGSVPSEHSHREAYISGDRRSVKHLKEVPFGTEKAAPLKVPLPSDISVSPSPSSSSTSVPISVTRNSQRPSRPDYFEAHGIRVNHAEVPPIPEDEYPDELKEKQFDICIIYAEDDVDKALSFKEFLEDHIRLSNGSPPKMCLLDKTDSLTYITSKIKHLEEAMKRSTYVFLYITRVFCEDNWAEMQKDECLMESLTNPLKQWCVVPVTTQPRRGGDPEKKYSIPWGLRCLKPIDLARITNGKCLFLVDM